MCERDRETAHDLEGRAGNVVGGVHGGKGRRDDGHQVVSVLRIHLTIPIRTLQYNRTACH